MTEREQFYQLRLDDCATPGFVSFDKPYYGTLEEIRGFIAALEQDEQCRENHANLIAAFHAYESGNHDAKHYAAFQEIPLLIPVDVLMRRVERLHDYAWTHMNIWECPYYLRCRELEAEQVWIETEKCCVRCLRTRFKNLELKSIVGDEWRPLNSGFWGYPHMLEYEEPYVYSRLLVSEEAFKTKKLALKNAQANQPGLCLDEVCDEMFGDG